MNALNTRSCNVGTTICISYIGDDGIFHNANVDLQYGAHYIGHVFYLHNTLYIAASGDSQTCLFIVSDRVVIPVGMDGALGSVTDAVQLRDVSPAKCVRICTSEYVVYISRGDGKFIESLRIDNDRKWRVGRLTRSSNVVDLFTCQRFSVKCSNRFYWRECVTGDTFQTPYGLDGVCIIQDSQIWDGVSVLWQRVDARFHRVTLYNIRKCLVIYDYIVEASYVRNTQLLAGNIICVVWFGGDRNMRYTIINITDGSEYMLS